MITALVFALVIMLLVVPHELGHLTAAKLFGIRVDEFGIGFLKRLWARKIGETEYSINILPLGGFVKIFGEDGDEDNSRSFSGKSFLVKTCVIAAGIVANIIVAVILFSVLAYSGTPTFGVEISAVTQGSPAQSVDMRAGDVILSFGDATEGSFGIEEVQTYINKQKGNAAAFTLLRNGNRISVTASPRLEPPEGEGPLGIQIGMRQVGVVHVPWYRAPLEGIKRAFTLLHLLIGGFITLFSSLFSGGVTADDVAGPVRIGIIARDTLAIGFKDFLNFVAFLSLNLAVFNILPIPALDGGRIFLLVTEKIIRRPIPSRISGPIHSVFLLLLMAFVVWISWREILALL